MAINKKLVAGRARLTKTMSRRGWRSRCGSTGTGLAYPKMGSPARAPMAGKMIDPNGSMWGSGFRVRRPARFAVSSPNQEATTPWLTSWRMIATTRHPNRMIAMCSGTRSARLGRAGDAQPGGRHGLEPGLGDVPTAALAAPVGALVDLRQGLVDLAERLGEGDRQGLHLAPLRRHLARIGEPAVEGQAGVGTPLELSELVLDADPLGFELGARHRMRRVG